MKKAAMFGIALASSLIFGLGAEAQQPEAEDSLKIYFDSGSSAIDADQRDILDLAARLFREGEPIVMIVSGAADTTGEADRNLKLSLRRAQAVADGLTARGIPASRLQVLGRGVSELEVVTGPNVSEVENRVAEITWR